MHDAGADQIPGLLAWRLDDLQVLFGERLQTWPHPFRDTPAGRVGIFDDLHELPADVAQALIGRAVLIARVFSTDTAPAYFDPDKEAFPAALILIASLARAAGSKEKPPKLDEAWDYLAERARTWLAERPQDTSVNDAWQSLAAYFDA